MTEKMLAIRKNHRAWGAELVEVPVPQVQPGCVLVRVDLAAICASDLQVYNWRADVANKVNLPLTMGHEYCGTVVEVGPGVKNLAVGDRVAGETHFPCGCCYMCHTGGQHICVDMKSVGRSYDGCFAQYMLVPEICAWKIPRNLDPKLGAIFEPFGVAVHGLQKTRLCGESVAILGCGPIGLMAVAAARHLGATQIFATSRSQEKLELALQMGADQALNPREVNVVEAIKEATNGDGVNIVLEVSGSTEAFEQGLEVLKHLGRFCLIGLPKEPVLFNADRYLIGKELNITGIFGRRMFDTWITAQELILGGNIGLEPLLGQVYSLEEFPTAFELVNAGIPQRLFFDPHR